MKTMLRLAQEHQTISVVNDQIGSPTHALDLAATILKVIDFHWQHKDSRLYGIYHFSNEGTASWHDFAAKIFELHHVSTALKLITTAQYPTPAKRPPYSVLDKSKIKTVFGISIRNWEDALRENA